MSRDNLDLRTNIRDRVWETATRAEIADIQLEKLKETVQYCYNKVPYYRHKLDEAKVHPNDIQTLQDIKRLPYTTKKDFHDTYPYGMFAVQQNELLRIHASSGTTGKPTVVGYTKNDMENWGELVARMATAAGVTDKDTVQISFGYGLFTGGFGLHYGLERIGAAIIPVSSGNTARQLMILEDFGPTTLVSTPSYAAHLGEEAKKRDMKIGTDIKLNWGLFGSEPWTEGMRHRVETELGLNATDNYGLSEIGGPGLSGECHTVRDGMHISEDMYFWEVIDPNTGEDVPEGALGELVITPLWKEALPILRYRTRDLTSVVTSPCACGRTTARMSRIHGRCDDMLIIRGVNVFPTQIEHILMQSEYTSPHYLLVVKSEGVLDILEVHIELNEQFSAATVGQLSKIQEKLAKDIHSVLGLSVKVKLVEPYSLERSLGKAKRVRDERNKD